MRGCSPSLAAVALAASGTVLAAQPAARPAPRLGIMAGATIAGLAGDEVEGLDRRTGLTIGGTLAIPLTRRVAFQPELLYVQKGAKGSQDAGTLEIRLHQIAVPLLLRVDVPRRGSAIRPHLYAGPAVAFKATCDVVVSGGGVRATTPCRALATADGREDLASVDAGLVLGGGLGLDVGRRRLNVGARYDLGLVDLGPEGEVRTRTVTIYGSLEFPLGG